MRYLSNFTLLRIHSCSCSSLCDAARPTLLPRRINTKFLPRGTILRALRMLSLSLFFLSSRRFLLRVVRNPTCRQALAECSPTQRRPWRAPRKRSVELDATFLAVASSSYIWSIDTQRGLWKNKAYMRDRGKKACKTSLSERSLGNNLVDKIILPAARPLCLAP